MPMMLRFTGGKGAHSTSTTPTTQLSGNTAASGTSGTSVAATRAGWTALGVGADALQFVHHRGRLRGTTERRARAAEQTVEQSRAQPLLDRKRTVHGAAPRGSCRQLGPPRRPNTAASRSHAPSWYGARGRPG